MVKIVLWFRFASKNSNLELRKKQVYTPKKGESEKKKKSSRDSSDHIMQLIYYIRIRVINQDDKV